MSLCGDKYCISKMLYSCCKYAEYFCFTPIMFHWYLDRCWLTAHHLRIKHCPLFILFPTLLPFGVGDSNM